MTVAACVKYCTRVLQSFIDQQIPGDSSLKVNLTGNE